MTWTITATDFKARCLDILDQVASGRLDRVVITARGRAAAVLTPPSDVGAGAEPHDGETLHGVLRGTVLIPDRFDLTAPTCDEAFMAEAGQLHG